MHIKDLKVSFSMEMTRLAQEKKAKGEDTFILSIGDIHFAPPNIIRKKLINGIDSDQTHYTNAQGLLELRKSILENLYSGFYDVDEIIITPGVKQGLYNFFLSSNQVGFVVLEPTWLGYQALASLTNKEYIPINSQNDDWRSLLSQASFSYLLLCSPNNPDGKVYSEEELDYIYEIVCKRSAMLIIDEIYQIYNYTKIENSIKKFYGLENVIIFNGFSKSHALTGLRIGYCLLKNKQRMNEMLKLQQNITTCVNSLAQFATIDFHKAENEIFFFKNYYKENKDLVSKIIPELKPFQPDGGFYYFFDLTIFNIKQDAQTFCSMLLKKYGVALVPGDAYGKNYDSWVRLSFSVDRDILEKGLYFLKKYLIEY